MESMAKPKKNMTADMTVTALMTAITCILVGILHVGRGHAGSQNAGQESTLILLIAHGVYVA